MFSYFKNGIRNTSEFDNISIEKLLRLIKENNPIIDSIRNLDIHTKSYAVNKKKLKRKLHYITPNCTVFYRDKKGIDKFSGYFYFDIDNNGKFKTKGDVSSYKNFLIDKYKGVIKLLCVSSSGYGLSMFVKVENEISMKNFAEARKYIVDTYFSDLDLDLTTKDESRPWYISNDIDCYYDPISIIEIPEGVLSNIIIPSPDLLLSIPKGALTNIIIPLPDLLVSAPFKNKSYKYKFYPISECRNVLKFKTEVSIDNKVIDIKPIEYVELYIPPAYRIPDSQKHNQFSNYIRILFHLNSDKIDYIFSFMNWVNENRTEIGHKMDFGEFIRYFSMIHLSIEKTGITSHKFRIKNIHIKDNTIDPIQRRIIADRLNGIIKMAASVNTIYEVKEVLGKVTQKYLFEYIKENSNLSMSIRTIKKYWNYDRIDIKEIE